MKKAAIAGIGQPLTITESEIPSEAPPHGLLLKVLASGVCHTDLHLINDETPLGDGKFLRCREIPGFKWIGVVPGHEICGEIIAIGRDVGTECPHQMGDRVLVYPWRGCRLCNVCKAGKTNWCEFNKSTTTDVGKGMDGQQDGGYQSHFPIPEWQNVVKLPDSISPDIGCMLPCSALTTYTALDKAKGSIEFGIEARGHANLLIIGAGGLGSWTVINARALYGDQIHIYCSDINPEKLDMAQGLGANKTYLSMPNMSLDEMVSLVTAEGKMDATIDLVGSPQTEKMAFFSLHNGGTMVPIGLIGGQLQLPIPILIGKSISVKGNRVGDINQLRELTALYAEKGFNKLPPIECFSIDDVNSVLEKLRNSQIAGRAVFKFD